MTEQKMTGRALYARERKRDLRELLRARVAASPGQLAYRYRGAERQTLTRSYAEFWTEIQRLGTALLERGLLRPGRRAEDGGASYQLARLAAKGALYEGRLGRPHTAVAVLGENAYPWVLAYSSLIFGAALAVPLDRDLGVEEASGLLRRAEVELLCFTSQKRAQALEMARACPQVKALLELDALPAFTGDLLEPGEVLPYGAAGPAADMASGHEGGRRPDPSVGAPATVGQELGSEPRTEWVDLDGRRLPLHTLSELLSWGERCIAIGWRSYQDLPIWPHDIAAVFFTSGTTAQSKGVMLSHDNITADIWAGLSIIDIKARSCLSILPLHHTFENTVGMLALWDWGVSISFNDSLRHLADNLRDWEIEALFMVPLVLETFQKRIQQGLRAQKKEGLVRVLLGLSRQLRRLGIDLRAPLFRRVRSAVAPKLQTLFVGGAALDPELQRFYLDLGYDLWIAYGLTEAAPGISAGNERSCLFASVGIPCAELELRIAPRQGQSPSQDQPGEVQLRFDTCMLGYYRDQEQSDQSIDADGWLHTGDLGYLKQGSLFLAGREKSMLVLANGKNIFPEELETSLARIPGVEGAMVWLLPNKRGQEELCCRLALDPTYVKTCQQEGRSMAEEVWQAVLVLNSGWPKYKRVRHALWSTEPLATTTTRKLKRHEERRRIEAWLARQQLDLLRLDLGEMEDFRAAEE